MKQDGCRHSAVWQAGHFPRGFCWGRYVYRGHYADHEANRGPGGAGQVDPGLEAVDSRPHACFQGL